MGACISIHHKASAMKAQVSFDSASEPDHKLAIHPVSSNGKLSAMDGHVPVKPQLPLSQSPATFSNYGSKEEVFFDSQAWLDSDFEDEFMSVNGEFTPSRGNTPVHHSTTLGMEQVLKGGVGASASFMDNNEPYGSTSQPSPTLTEKRKRLLDLFKESVRDNHDSNFEITDPTKSNKDGEMGSNKDSLKPKSESHVGSSRHGCFSSLLSVRSTGRQKKNPNLNPNHSFGPSPIVG